MSHQEAVVGVPSCKNFRWLGILLWCEYYLIFLFIEVVHHLVIAPICNTKKLPNRQIKLNFFLINEKR